LVELDEHRHEGALRVQVHGGEEDVPVIYDI
jgi:hypothetical protein